MSEAKAAGLGSATSSCLLAAPALSPWEPPQQLSSKGSGVLPRLLPHQGKVPTCHSSQVPCKQNKVVHSLGFNVVPCRPEPSEKNKIDKEERRRKNRRNLGKERSRKIGSSGARRRRWSQRGGRASRGGRGGGGGVIWSVMAATTRL